MKKLLLLAALFAGGAFAQCGAWANFTSLTASTNLSGAMNGKMNVQCGTTTPVGTVAGTAGVDAYINTSNGNFYVCTSTGTPCGNWALQTGGSGGGSCALGNKTGAVAINASTCSGTAVGAAPFTFWSFTQTGNVTVTFAGTAGYYYQFNATQNGTGGYTLTYPSSSPTFTQTPSVVTNAGTVNTYVGFYDGTTMWYAGPGNSTIAQGAGVADPTAAPATGAVQGYYSSTSLLPRSWNGTNYGTHVIYRASTAGVGYTAGNCNTNLWVSFVGYDGQLGCTQAASTNLSDTANLVRTTAGATYGAFLYNFSGSTMEIPTAGGFVASAVSNLGLDSTAHNLHIWNGNDRIIGLMSGSFTNGDCLEVSQPATTIAIIDAGGPCGTSGMVYPGAGIANSTGSAWGTSYTTTGTGTVLALATSPTFVTPVLGTVASGSILTNATGLPVATGISGLGTGVATFLATPSSANLATAMTTSTGTGNLVFGTSPTLVTPALGTPASGNATNLTNIPITLTTTGSSGAATYTQSTNTLNVPQYTGGSGGGAALNPPCTFSAAATGCSSPISVASLAVPNANYNSIITQCWTGAGTTQTTLAIINYTYVTGATYVSTVAPTFAAAAAAGYCTANLTSGANSIPDPAALGFIAETATGTPPTVAARTLTAGNGITITNPAGTAGNPSIANSNFASAASSYGLTDFICNITSTTGGYGCTTNVGTTVTFYQNPIVTFSGAATSSTLDGTHASYHFFSQFDLIGTSTNSFIINLYACATVGAGVCTGATSIWSITPLGVTTTHTGEGFDCYVTETASNTVVATCNNRQFTVNANVAPTTSGISSTAANWGLQWGISWNSNTASGNVLAQLANTGKSFY